MKTVILRLYQIENEHRDFFDKAGTSILDYISGGLFNSGVFNNTDLPPVIVEKINKVFDETSSAPDN